MIASFPTYETSTISLIAKAYLIKNYGLFRFTIEKRITLSNK